VDLGLSGKRALVGGGGSGIGAGIAAALSSEDARVVIAGRTADRLARTADDIGATGVVADLSTTDGPAVAVDAAVEALGGLDLLVVNSGGPPAGTFEQLGEAEWLSAIDGTLQSALRLIRAALPHLRDGSDPAIVINLSSSVREPIAGLTTSNVLRPGLVGLVKSLTAEGFLALWIT
jgi:3-oxoacyl-[acyl-carrier protein] reductase